MYNVNNLRAMKKAVKEMKTGEVIFINIICLTEKAVDQLRQYIIDGVLVPDEEQAKELYKVPEDVMTGSVILPQMEYIKR